MSTGTIKKRAATDHHRSPWPRRAVIGVGGLMGLYLLGFLVFIANLDQTPIPLPATAPANAIVVLTGGPERIHTGLDLLEQTKGGRLLISGVHPQVTKETLKELVGDGGGLLDCCVDLGRTAEDTIGNATEVADWAAQHNYQSIILVTSTYHMPRALLELRRAMPARTITAYPVFQDNLHIDEWWRYPGTAKLLMAEYAKYLIAQFRAPTLRA